MNKVHREKNEYPLVLGVQDIREIMSISQRRAYEIMDIEGFPLIKHIGRSKRVQREKFFQWLEGETK